MKALEAEQAPKRVQSRTRLVAVVEEAGGQRDRANLQHQVSFIHFLIKKQQQRSLTLYSRSAFNRKLLFINWVQVDLLVICV
jgi:hypothetical protein